MGAPLRIVPSGSWHTKGVADSIGLISRSPRSAERLPSLLSDPTDLLPPYVPCDQHAEADPDPVDQHIGGPPGPVRHVGLSNLCADCMQHEKRDGNRARRSRWSPDPG